MGHLVFVVLHLLAVALGMVLLFVTIPAHLIYSAVRKPAGDGVKLPAASHTADLLFVAAVLSVLLWWWFS